MPQLQDIFNRIQATQKEQRELKASYRDALATSPSYQDVINDLQVLKDKKKQLETAIKAEFRSEFDRLERIKRDLETDKIMMSDLAFNQLVKGQAISLTDQDNNQYEPIFTVRFKKVG